MSPLLRRRFESPQKARQVGQDGLDGRALGVQAGDREVRLSRVMRVRGNAMQQQRTAGDCVFRPKPATDSDASRPPIPTERGH